MVSTDYYKREVPQLLATCLAQCRDGVANESIVLTLEAHPSTKGPVPWVSHNVALFPGLDCESIWAELELRNKALEKHARRSMGRLLQSGHVSVSLWARALRLLHPVAELQSKSSFFLLWRVPGNARTELEDWRT